ncbi:IMP dehydrogenase, partial [Microbacterium sp. Kw_RZR3]
MEFSGAQPDVDLTYSDVFLVPRHSEVRSRLDVDLAPGDGSGATLPLVSANMNSVTGTRLAATLARRGGLGVLPQDLPLPELVDAVGWVKAQPVAWDAPLVLPPSATVADARLILPPVPGRGIVVADPRDDGVIALTDFRGIVPAPRLATALPDATLGDIARTDAPLVEVTQVGDPREVFALVGEADIVAVVDGDRIVGTL